MTKRKTRATRSRWVAAVCVLAACGGGGGGSSPDSGVATVNVLLSDAPVDTLSAFNVTVTSIRLVLPDDTVTTNLLGASQHANLLDLVTRSALLQVSALPPDTYKGVSVEIDAASVSARDLSGAAVAVQVQSSTATAIFASPLTVTAVSSTKLGVEIDVDESLTDNPGGGVIFSPAVVAGPRSEIGRAHV